MHSAASHALRGLWAAIVAGARTTATAPPSTAASASLRRALSSLHGGPFGALPEGVADAARALSAALDKADIPHAVVGAVAANAHGHRRATQDVDVLVNKRDLDAVSQALVGRGWQTRYRGTQRRFVDTARRVDVDVLVSGEYPGDGQPKPVAFPAVAKPPSRDGLWPELVDGVYVLRLAKLIELKLASGVSAPHRRKDLADVQALITANGLPREFADELDLSVRLVYAKLWDELKEAHDRVLPA